MSRPVLTINGLSKGFQDGAVRRGVLEDLNLVVHSGEVLAVCGPSGSGKSTLLNLVAGTIDADAGSLLLATPDGALELAVLGDADRTRVRRRYLGYVFQFFNLVPTLTVRENVLLPLELNGLEQLADESLARLASLGLGDRLDDFPEQLSGGERQRTAIARALAHRPLLVLADEPTGNLDRGNAERVADLLWREVRQSGAALIVATHDQALAGRADHLIQLSS
jgi:putative ABC transport system ATP-binding protein